MDFQDYEKLVENKERHITLKRILDECRNHWIGCAIFFVCTIAVAILFLLIVTPKYERDAEVLIKDEDNSSNSLLSSAVASNLGVFSNLGMFHISSNVNNEIRILQAMSTLEELVKRLDLNTSYQIQHGLFYQEVCDKNLPIRVSFANIDDSSKGQVIVKLNKNGEVTLSDFKKEKTDYDDEFKGKINSVIHTPIGSICITPTKYFPKAFSDQEEITVKVKKDRVYDTADEISKVIKIENSDDQTSVIELSYQDITAKRTERVINTLISIYKEKHFKEKMTSMQSSAKFVNDRISDIEKTLSGLDNHIMDFKSDNMILDYAGNAKMYLETSLVENEMAAKLNNQLYMLQNMSNLAKGANNYQPLPGNLLPDNENVAKQIINYNELLMKRNNMLQNSSEKNPLVEELTRQVNAMRKALATSLDHAVAQAKLQAKNMQQTKNSTNSEIASAPQKVKKILPIERQQKVIEQLYIFLLQKKEEIELSNLFVSDNARVISQPTGKFKPVFPKKIRTMAAAVLFGILFPFIFFFIKLYLSKTIRRKEDIFGTSLHLCAELPEEHEANYDDAIRILRNRMTKNKKNNESYNLLICPTLKGSGATHTALNLAKSLSRLPKMKTLLIDADTRYYTLTSTYGAQHEGLTDLLQKEDAANQDSYIMQLQENLYFMPLGTERDHAVDILLSPYGKSLMSELSKVYDFIVIDTPSLLHYSDVEMFADACQRSLLVIRSGMASINDIRNIEKLENDGIIKNVQLILNGENNR